MRTPEEFLDLQYRHAARSAKALANVDDERLIKMNATHYLEKTIMAFLVALRFSLEFSQQALIDAIEVFESNLEVLIKFEETNFTTYLLACMLLERNPNQRILEASYKKMHDIDFLINSSVVPYIHYDLVSSDSIGKLCEVSDKKRKLAIESAATYADIMQSKMSPSEVQRKTIASLFCKRKNNGFYSESRLYGGGPDNDYVCDIEYAAIATARGELDRAIPCS